MSQQINLLLPELRPRFDWLALPVVAGIAAAGLVLLLALAQVQSFQLARQKAAEADLNGQLLNLQQQVQTLGQSLAARLPSTSLPLEIAALRTGVAQRQEVLAFTRCRTASAASDKGQDLLALPSARRSWPLSDAALAVRHRVLPTCCKALPGRALTASGWSASGWPGMMSKSVAACSIRPACRFISVA